jgi:hypothetical protein
MRVAWMAAAGLLVAAVFPSDAAGHLFHKTYEPPENQMTRDTRLLQLVLDDPAGRFDLARSVWEGTTRVRVKPGGFRKWLVRPSEPGQVFKGDYQIHRWSGSLKTEAARIDRRHGTTLVERIESCWMPCGRTWTTSRPRSACIRSCSGITRSTSRGT